jgi:hypothetical protein
MSLRVITVLLGTMVALIGAAALGIGGPAKADQVWYQSYERTSPTEVCTAQPGETSWQSTWGPDASWHPSWEMWANGGRGGWTCGRAITWARDTVSTTGSSTSPCASASDTFTIGDTGPGCGIVFYKDLTQPAGKQYMEAAPNTWSGGVSDPTLAWCSDTTNAVSTSTAIGTGSANTTAMLTDAAPFVACSSGAGFAARAYSGGGQHDWFLPSTDELNVLYGQKTLAGGFADNSYWSSSQYSVASGANYQLFANGDPGAMSKGAMNNVRPVRAF